MTPLIILADIDWKSFWFGDEQWEFLFETGLRTIIMFAILLTSLTILGKRGVRQLSVFELVVIIGLGSAAGDPMFYKDVGILPSLMVFILVVGCYIFITYLVGKSKKIEQVLEGKPVYLIDEGSFAIEHFQKETLAQDEFFAELRIKGVSHLGQIRLAIIETNGDISIFYYTDEKVKYGLPILPREYEDQHLQIPSAGHYSCAHCGRTEELRSGESKKCQECERNLWVRSCNDCRIP